MRWLITILEPEPTQNAHGESVLNWTASMDLWADKEEASGREVTDTQQKLSEGVTRFRTRYIEGITSQMRILCNGLEYDITSASDPDGRQTTLVLDTTRKE